jgi:drug/metabolite transporter (DMT)-like permease
MIRVGMSKHRLGFALVASSAVAWSLGGLFTRLITVDSWTMLAWRGLFGAAALGAVVVAQSRGGLWRDLKNMGWVGWLFVGQSTAGMIFYLSALRHTSVANVAVIYATAPFLAAGLGWLMMREMPTLGSLGASLAALAGVLIMVGFGGTGGWVGDLLALGMTVSMAVATVVARHYRQIPILPTACLSALLSAALTWPFATPMGATPHDLGLLALFGILNFGLGLPLFAFGARFLPAIETALIGAVEAPLAPLWVWLALGETPSKATMLGGAIVCAAVAIHLISSAPTPVITSEASSASCH